MPSRARSTWCSPMPSWRPARQPGKRAVQTTTPARCGNTPKPSATPRRAPSPIRVARPRHTSTPTSSVAMPLSRRAARWLLAAVLLALALPAAAQTTTGDWNGPYLGFTAGAKLDDATWTATQLNGGGDARTPFTPVDGSSPRGYDLTAARV